MACATQFWESTRPQRDEIARTASTISQSVQPALEIIKQESTKAIETIAATVNEVASGQESSRGEHLSSGTATEDD